MMLEQIERAVSFGLVCWRVLLLDKEMLIFPILGTLALGLIFGGHYIFSGASANRGRDSRHQGETPF